MANYFKKLAEWTNLAKSINSVHLQVQQLLPKIERETYETEDVLVMAFVVRRGILDRLDEYDWPMESKIMIPSIKMGFITLAYALTQTVGKLSIISEMTNLSDEVQDIIDKGNGYYQMEEMLPKELINSL